MEIIIIYLSFILSTHVYSSNTYILAFGSFQYVVGAYTLNCTIVQGLVCCTLSFQGHDSLRHAPCRLDQFMSQHADSNYMQLYMICSLFGVYSHDCKVPIYQYTFLVLYIFLQSMLQTILAAENRFLKQEVGILYPVHLMIHTI